MNTVSDLRTLIQKRTGLHYMPDKEEDLQRAVRRAMQQENVNDERVYYWRLYNALTDDPIWSKLIENLTVNETYFFRDSSQFRAMRESILPEIIQKHREANYLSLRLWSAGCSTGEEPYSLAILLTELLPDIERWTITITGTDINRESLEKARQGIFRERSFRNETPEVVKDRYFTRVDNDYHLKPEVKKPVYFEYVNLIEDPFPATLNALDLIICRNVTIYFPMETTIHVVKRFYERLLPESWLIVGHSEPMNSVYRRFQPRNFPGAIAYQKPLEDASELLKVETPPEVAPSIAALKVDAPVAKTDVVSEKRQPAETPEAPAVEAYEKGKAFADRMEFSEAHQWLTRALALNPLMLEAHFTRAMVYMHEGDNQAALEALRRALYIDSSFVLAHFNAGLIRWQMNHIKEARRSWKITRNLLTDIPPYTPLPYGDGMTAGYVLAVIRSYEE